MKIDVKNCGVIFIRLAMLYIIFCLAPWAQAVVGIPDRVPAATLLVPFFEVGVESGEGTLLVITNQGHTDSILHCTVWDRDGNPQASQNISINNHAEWHISMSEWLDALELLNPGIKANLQVENYYWGYITFDSVSEATVLNPYDDGYPFAENNDFTGWIYYVDLLQGKSNGMCMVPIEAVTSSVTQVLQTGFYDNIHDTSREEINGQARYYAHALTTGQSYSEPDYMEMFGRFYQDEALKGNTRVIIWRYFPLEHGAIATKCDNAYIKSETGETTTPSITLNHVVNVIDIADYTTAEEFPAGWIYLFFKQNITTYPLLHETYAFTVNSANYEASLNWMALFEMQIEVHKIQIDDSITITLNADPPDILADGSSTSTITAEFKDGNGDPIPEGVSVTFTTTLGTFVNDDQTYTLQTTDTGKLTLALYGGTTPGTATITAALGSSAEQVPVTLHRAPTRIDLTASTLAEGRFMIEATVYDAISYPVLDGTSVYFSVIKGAGTLSPDEATTSRGVASVIYTTSTTTGTETIGATTKNGASSSVDLDCGG